MANYRNISIGFWSDPKVDDDFTPEDKYFYLYLITNPHTNICGCYEIGKKQIERETGYNWDTVSRLIDRMEKVHNVIRYNSDTKEILLLNWGRYNWSRSEKVLSAVKSVASHIKTKSFKNYVVNTIEQKVYGCSEYSPQIPDMQTTDKQTTDKQITDIQVTDKQIADIRKQSVSTDVPIGYGYPIDTHKKTKQKRFVPPTPEDVELYCFEKGIKVDVEHFIDYYESNGWKVGKNPMKDWKATVRNWARRDTGKKKNEIDEWREIYEGYRDCETADDRTGIVSELPFGK